MTREKNNNPKRTKKRNNILVLQDKYLKTKDEKTLSQLYVELIRLGKFTIKKKGFGDYEMLEDIVTDYIIRLIDDDKNIIKIKHPSGYLKNSLFFKSKYQQKRIKLLSDEDYFNSETLVFKQISPILTSFEEVIVDEINSEEIFNKIYLTIDTFLNEHELTTEEEDLLTDYIIDCLELGKYYKKYTYKINSKKLSILFELCFEKIEKKLKEQVEFGTENNKHL